MTSDWRVLIGEYFPFKKKKSNRGWLCNASLNTLERSKWLEGGE